VLLALILVLVALGGAALSRALVKGRHGTSSPPADPIRAEFEQVAARLFRSPGGQLDMTRSTVLRQALARGLSQKDQLVGRGELVHALLKEARTQEAVQEVEALFAMLRQQPEALRAEPEFHRLRGLTYLRQAEVENCVKRHNRSCCVYPLKDGGVHPVKMPASQAAASFQAFLEAKPDDLVARWLLNITHMAMGTYPDSVPPGLLVPEEGPGSSAEFPRFQDVARDCGITRLNHAGGVVADDMDGDGLLDLVLTSVTPDAPIAYYHNRGDGTFEDLAEAAGLANQLGGLNLVSTDYDNDGHVDLLVLRGAWLFDEGRIRKSLLRNNGNGTFTDVTATAGLAHTEAPSQVGVWLDYDNDGDLDLFLGNESRADRSVFPPEPGGAGNYPSNLFANNGDGTFTDVARQAGVTNDRFCKGAAAGDYDNDGWIDLFVSNIGRERLYHNNGDGTFTDVAEELGVVEPVGRSFATWFFDVDNDGNLDIYVGSYELFTEDIPAWYLGLPFKSPPPRLYRNRGDGTFEDITRAAGLWRPMQPMGANFGDLDNDGWLDMYLTTGNPDYAALMPNLMFRNDGGDKFVDVTRAGGFGNLQKGHGVAFADFDHDGDQDVFNELGGFFRGDTFYNTLYENPGNQNHHLTLKLIGERSNRLAYGARIKVVVDTPRGERALHRAVGSVSSFGSAQARQEIGLGDATAIRDIEIWWPASGIRQRLTGLEMDAFYEITEGVDTPRKLSLQRYTLGAGS
jgi:hypothetical protein